MTTCEPSQLVSYPLSAAQRRLWFIARLSPDSCAYHNTHVIRYTGCLDADRLIACLHEVIERHESLRMHFAKSSSLAEDVAAIVTPGVRIAVPTLDVSDLPPAQIPAYERQFVDGFAREPFDLAAGPLVRAALLRLDANSHIFVIVVHHIVFDRWSFGVLMRELSMLYRASDAAAEAGCAPLAAGYGRCSEAEAADVGRADTHLDYWRTLLGGERQTLELPLDYSRPCVPSDRGATVATTLPAELVARVSRVGAKRGATPYMTFLAAFFLLLHRSTGQTDVLVGTPVAGRGRLEREPLIGLFVNTLPVRMRMAPDESFAVLLARVRAATLGMLAHADVPFDRLVREELAGREGFRNPFFDVLFNFHNIPSAGQWTSGLDVRCEDVDLGTSRLDLAVILRPEADGSMTCRFEYSSDLFERATIDILTAHFRVLLASIAADPDASVACLPIASTVELDTIVNGWSRPTTTGRVLPLTAREQTLHRLVALNAERRPQATALIEDGGEPVTYAELERRANRLAHALRALGVGRDVRVGLYLERSVNAVVAMLATLKAGGAYVPLDPAYPTERTDYMLAKAGVKTIVARARSVASLSYRGLQLLDIEDPEIALCEADDPPSDSCDSAALAYVMFTSGSTGKPKAVAIAHGGAAALLAHTPVLACTPADTMLLHGALTFDASVFVWAPLVWGARVAVMPAGPFSLAEFSAQLTRYDVSVLDVSAALFHQLVEERIDGLHGVRRLIVGGDVLSPASSETFVRAVPGCRLFNAYGPTETTVVASVHEISVNALARRSVPIGRPVADARLYILDDRRSPVAIGVPGELWIGGRGVAREYLDDPALTQERFAPDPFATDPAARVYRSGDRVRWLPDGAIEFLGRVDAQVKIRGFRIEPAEIEFALLEHPAVRHAVVVVRGETVADRRLLGYVEIRSAGVTEAALRAFLQTKLPPHAIPARLIVLDELPKTTSGKLDRLHLPEAPVPGRIVDAGPQSDTERTLASIVAELLGVDRVGRDDDFFAIGGHSLLATRVIARIADTFEVDLSLRSFFSAPSVAGLVLLIAAAPRLEAARAASVAGPDVDALTEGELDALLAAEFTRTPHLGCPTTP